LGAKEKTAYLWTLGCKVNQEDGVALAAHLEKSGWRIVGKGEKADAYIINTCSVTKKAETEACRMLRRAHLLNPDALLVVCGCFAQVAPQEAAALPGVGLVVGIGFRHLLPDLLEAVWHKRSARPLIKVDDSRKERAYRLLEGEGAQSSRTRAFLKIQDGCNRFCTYCIVPYARGPERSKPIDEVLAEASHLLAEGYKEIVLTGIHIGSYGHDLPEDINLASLLRKLVCLPGLARLRLGSLEPYEINDELLSFMAAGQVIAPHLHIPLQSGCDKTLAAMERRYTSSDYRNLLVKIRSLLPDVAISTDIIAGFPGESEEDFTVSCDFASAMGFMKMHVFPYSPRRLTAAAKLPDQINAAEKTRRTHVLLAIDQVAGNSFRGNYIGKELVVLPEQKKVIAGHNYLLGHSGNFLQVAISVDEGRQGELIHVKALRQEDGILFAKGLDE